ncbi:hypothetical protein D3C71_1693870 [compost metagenome]
MLGRYSSSVLSVELSQLQPGRLVQVQPNIPAMVSALSSMSWVLLAPLGMAITALVYSTKLPSVSGSGRKKYRSLQPGWKRKKWLSSIAPQPGRQALWSAPAYQRCAALPIELSSGAPRSWASANTLAHCWCR